MNLLNILIKSIFYLQCNGLLYNTHDFVGVINIKDEIQCLIENMKYLMNWSSSSGDYELIDNQNLVMKKCIIFIHWTELNNVWYKFFSKFIHSLMISSFQDKIFIHIIILLYISDEHLRNNINNNFESCLLRLELTFYKENNAVPDG